MNSTPDTDYDRFAFGANWSRFLRFLKSERIDQSARAIAEFLNQSDLTNLTFLDIGSGSGLSSLAARKLGAKVFSFDYDTLSVACTQELKRRFYSEDPDWRIEQGSALDPTYISSLGKFDIVYSWGVLHHTGNMWQALDLATLPVKEGGLLYIAIYNDQGTLSRMWWHIKRTYNRSNRAIRWLMVCFIASLYEVMRALYRLCIFRNPLPFKRWRTQRKERGMSIWYDWVDWIGGFPFEVASPEKIIAFYKEQGTLKKSITKGKDWGCCEYLFIREQS